MLEVRSINTSTDKYNFYIKNFMNISDYIWLSHNYNKYKLIITNELEDDINILYNKLIAIAKNPKFDYQNNLEFIYQTEEQLNIVKKFGFNYSLITEKINDLFNNNNLFNDNYLPITASKSKWIFKHHSLFNEYYTSPEFQVIIIEGIENHWNILPYLTNKTITYIQWACTFGIWNYKYARDILYTVNQNYNLKNIIWLSPDLDGILWAYEYGFNAILCNHNCWLDYNIFKIEPKEQIYNMVMNCRPEYNFKRPYLAKKVENLAYIKGSVYTPEDVYDYSELNMKYVNEEIINKNDVIDIYNKSFCGGIFSSREGACYSSSEYLLCGLPVISTLSKGGRETWYNETNSIIVEPNDDDVNNAVQVILQRYSDGLIDRNKIREDHIKFSLEMRNNFNKSIQDLFDKNNVDINAYEYLNEKYFHCMKHNISITNAINILLKDDKLVNTDIDMMIIN